MLQSVNNPEKLTIESLTTDKATKKGDKVFFGVIENAIHRREVIGNNEGVESVIVSGTGGVHMSSERQNHLLESTEPQTHTAPQPPPFNPMASHSGQPPSATALGNSVVPDLMKVYESMTQSSTPQDPSGLIPSSESHYHQHEGYANYQYPSLDHASQPPQQGYYDSAAQAQRYYDAPPGSYEGQAPPEVPPVPPYPPVPDFPSVTSDAPPPPPVVQETPDEPSSSGSNGNGRSLRKRSLEKDGTSSEKSNSKVRKKGNTSDGRWSKRFTWPDDLHRDFVSAIFDVGLKHSSPSAILEHMPKNDQITSERIKSHLQKYRVHRTKSKKEFMTCYDASLSKFKAGSGADRGKPLADGEVAAHLSHSTITDADTTVEERKEEGEELPKVPPKPKDQSSKLILPQLSEAEKKSPIGTSLGYLMGLFFSLRQQLMAQREAQSAAGVNVPPFTVADKSSVGDVYTQFTGIQGTYSQEPPIDWHPPAPHNGQLYQQDPTVDQKQDPKAAPSTRTNFQQNKFIKREMEGQMAVQSMMRGIKQRELNKYRSHELPPDDNKDDDVKGLDDDLTPNPVGKSVDHKNVDESTMNRSQGAGEAAEADDSGEKGGRCRGLSVSVAEDFWNSDVVDDQLFEFLMDT